MLNASDGLLNASDGLLNASDGLLNASDGLLNASDSLLNAFSEIRKSGNNSVFELFPHFFIDGQFKKCLELLLKLLNFSTLQLSTRFLRWECCTSR